MKFTFAVFLACALLEIVLGQQQHPRCFKKPSQHGLCYEGYERWTYYPRINQCRSFTYNGCMGNGNRFPTRQICERYCKI
ncbi:hemolymph trypsin inhibitor B-like [Drosophila novamexicana]|uniref:hemolymph trypsin inhibitor B-like n=1 Tax=Drosophila novamexicana TaxID=47314 RepID=UPI0011E5D460|nr:hemolymph trypsin inhibitor B-like [Drosophila novamexicana]